MITVATTVPVVLPRSEILGQPPIETSPRPSATGSLQAAVEAEVPPAVDVVVVEVVAEPVPELAARLVHVSRLPLF